MNGLEAADISIDWTADSIRHFESEIISFILFFRMSSMHVKLEVSPRQRVCTISSFCFKRPTSIRSYIQSILIFTAYFIP